MVTLKIMTICCYSPLHLFLTIPGLLSHPSKSSAGQTSSHLGRRSAVGAGHKGLECHEAFAIRADVRKVCADVVALEPTERFRLFASGESRAAVIFDLDLATVLSCSEAEEEEGERENWLPDLRLKFA
ncbi:hypothetical protein FVEG_17660 [Fusarium verticillioides 7600]|uniref:Uncharacterized protein n=1 Tax=Gibberella moniliformis (strain M3125 / FGSC 7600) TaxID=334819 RepID=A0A139YBF0_GIBM7|nr:hypothetical protein FVEG_17660 [Fusarium verticillioides 7600]KYG13646.1 hypothetical protein FVEG_17660 [Fusarium verticillioides 7600]